MGIVFNLLYTNKRITNDFSSYNIYNDSCMYYMEYISKYKNDK